MRMNFPHHALHTYGQTNADNAQRVLDAARARQAKSGEIKMHEQSVYQSASYNIKSRMLFPAGTGKTSQLVGYGAEKKS